MSNKLSKQCFIWETLLKATGHKVEPYTIKKDPLNKGVFILSTKIKRKKKDAV